MTLQKLNIPPKTDNAAKKQMVQSNAIGANETLLASEVNAMVAKTNELVDAYNFGSPITAFNYKTTVATYADLPLTGNQVNDGYGVASEGLVYVWNGTAFPPIDKGLDLGLKPVGKVQAGDALAVSGGQVYEAVNPIDNVLFNIVEKGTNFISELISSDIDDTELWGVGFFNSNGGVNNSNSNFRYTKKFYRIDGSFLDWNIGVYGDASILLYDKDYNLITGLKKGSSNVNTYYKVDNYEKPAGAVFFKLSHYVPTFNVANIYIRNADKIIEPKSDIFLESSKTVEVVSDVLKNYDVETILEGTEFISELINSDLTNQELWVSGYLNAIGGTSTASNWVRTKKKYRLPKGAYKIDINVNGNAVGLILNKDGTVRQVLAAQVGGYRQTFLVSLEQEADFMTSNPTESNVSFISRLSLKNIQTIYPDIITVSNFNSLLPPSAKTTLRNIYIDTFRPKKKRPIVTIISDDGASENLSWFKPILDEFRVKASFAIVGEWTEKADLGTRSGTLKSHQLRELFNEGHDIVSHTWTHTRNWNTELTFEQIEEEMSRTKVYLERITTTPVNMFVSPFGIRNIAIDNIVSRYYDANFISWTTYNNDIPLDNYYIKRCSFDCDEDNFQLLWDTTLKSAIDDAINNNRWLVFAVHPHYHQYSSRNPDYEARKNELRTLLQYCKDNNIEVTTAKKGYEYYKNHVNIGVRRYDSKVYQLGMDGSEYNLNYFE